MKLTEQEYESIRKIVYEHSRIDLGDKKRELVTARLGKRLRATGIPTYTEYVGLVASKKGEGELTHLIDAISTNHTFFFREIKHFEFLRETILPQAMARRGEPFRVWSAASSSGEEPYSIAIDLEECASRTPGWHWSVDATDISTQILKKAETAIYPGERLREVPPHLMKAYFQKGTGEWEGHFRVKEELRKRVNYIHLNLLQPSYPFRERFQLIWCRNVMIYFDRATQEQLVASLTAQLVPGGHLFIGHSESLTGIPHGLKALRPAIYQKPA